MNEAGYRKKISAVSKEYLQAPCLRLAKNTMFIQDVDWNHGIVIRACFKKRRIISDSVTLV